MFTSKYSIILLSLLMTNISYAAENNTKPDIGLNSQKNPFVKVAPVVPASAMNLPGALPQGTNMITVAPTTSPRGLFSIDESSNEQKTDWDNLKVVGFVNNYVILRVVDDNSNGEPKTIFTDLDTKFFINRNQYSIKHNNKIFTIYNKNNQPVHRLTIGNAAAHLIPRNNTASSSSPMGGSSGYSLNVNSGNNQNGANGGTGK